MATVKGVDITKIAQTQSAYSGYGSGSSSPKSRGYVNIGIGAGIIVGINIGLKIDSNGGVHPYVGGGFMLRGIGGSITYSPSKASSGCEGEVSAFFGCRYKPLLGGRPRDAWRICGRNMYMVE
jgi:hypothetical protein